MKNEDAINWKIIKVGNLIFEQHEQRTPLLSHKLFGDPTITLITGEKNIIVDPGYGPYRERVALKSELKLQEKILQSYLELAGIETWDIDLVFVTHDHADHCNLSGMFERAGAKIINGGIEGRQIIWGVTVLKTRGHDFNHCCLIYWFNNREIYQRRLCYCSLAKKKKGV